MNNKLLALAAAVIALLGLGVVVILQLALGQMRFGSPYILRLLAAQRAASPSRVCPLPARLAPSSYQADPAQTVGDYLSITFTLECAQPGQPMQTIDGFAAIGLRGDTCTGWASNPPSVPVTTGPVTIDRASSGRCGNAGAQGSFSLVYGRVSGAGVVTAQVLFADGATANGPVRNGRFVVGAPQAATICLVRVLDAGGAVLDEMIINSANAVVQGTCP
jgi:hypothetical protein